VAEKHLLGAIPPHGQRAKAKYPLRLAFGHCDAIKCVASLSYSRFMKRSRILLADDHELMLEGIRTILAPHYEIVGAVADGQALVETALRLRPDLIVVDITMPLLNGIDAASQIKMSEPGTKLVFVTMHASTAYIEAAFEAGGTGYVLKSGIREELLEAVHSVLSGYIYLSPNLSTEHLERFQNPTRATTIRLSVPERKTLQLIAEGRPPKRPEP
jgi:DNA-binding NarL/FixJ family response regulator